MTAVPGSIDEPKERLLELRESNMSTNSDDKSFGKPRIQLLARKFQRSAILLLLVVLVLLPKSVAGQGIEQEFKFNGTVELSPVPESEDLSATAVWAWLSLTGSYYRSALSDRVDLNPPISDPDALLVKQFVRRPATDVLAVDFEAIVSLTSESVNYDPASIILRAFQAEDTILEYTSALKSLGLSVFEEVTSVNMIIIPEPEAPTANPTANPTNDLESKYVTTKLVLKFTPAPIPMDGPIMERWKALTTDYLCTYIGSLNDIALALPDDGSACLEIESVVQEHTPNLRNNTIEVSKEASKPKGDGLRRRNYGRKLQEEELPLSSLGPLELEFVSKIELPPVYDAVSLIDGAFDTLTERVAYRNWILEGLLSDENAGEIPSEYVSFFQFLVQVEIKEVDATENSNDLEPTTSSTFSPTALNSEDASTNFFLDLGIDLQWIAVIGAVILLILLAGGLWCCVRCKKSKKTIKTQPIDGDHYSFEDEIPLSMTPQPQLDFSAAEIVVGHVGEDDLSTIGPPLVFGQGEVDDRTAATSILLTDTYNELLGRVPSEIGRVPSKIGRVPSTSSRVTKDTVPNTVSL